MAKGQVTFEFNDEQIAEIQRRVCDGVEHILESLQKENQELKEENTTLKLDFILRAEECDRHAMEACEAKKEIQELKSENKKLIEMCISISSWIYSLAKYSNDANNKLKANAWFEGVKQKHFNEVVYGCNK